jgi:hypothetical protein
MMQQYPAQNNPGQQGSVSQARPELPVPQSESVRAENTDSEESVDARPIDLPALPPQANQALPGAQSPQSGTQPSEPDNPYSN